MFNRLYLANTRKLSSKVMKMSINFDAFALLSFSSNTPYNSYSTTRNSLSTEQYPHIPSTYEPLSHDIHRSNVISSPDAKQLVILHGILGSKRNWRAPCLRWIQKKPDYECIAVDHRGHGSSLHPHFTNNIISPHTVSSCAQDLHHLLSNHLDIQPHVLLAHSFGGKVALSYLQHAMQHHIELPKHTWIIDSIPGIYHRSESDGQSVTKLFKILQSLPREFPSKEWMVHQLVSHGMDKSVALWLAMNIIPIESRVDERGSEIPVMVGWGFDLDTILALFNDFCDLDMWKFLEQYHPHGDEQIHFLRAGKNANWTDDMIHRMEDLSYQNPNIKFHSMKHVGHWIHVDDLEGMLQLIFEQSKI